MTKNQIAAKAAKAEFKSTQTETIVAPVAKTTEQKLAEAEAKIAELESRKSNRAVKGVRVSFLTQNGTKVEGFGQKYYVVRMNGKLYYKQEDSVTLL